MGTCKSKDNSRFDRAKVADFKSASVCCDKGMPKPRSHCLNRFSEEGSDVIGVSGEDGGNKLGWVVSFKKFFARSIKSFANFK